MGFLLKINSLLSCMIRLVCNEHLTLRTIYHTPNKMNDIPDISWWPNPEVLLQPHLDLRGLRIVPAQSQKKTPKGVS